MNRYSKNAICFLIIAFVLGLVACMVTGLVQMFLGLTAGLSLFVSMFNGLMSSWEG